MTVEFDEITARDSFATSTTATDNADTQADLKEDDQKALDTALNALNPTGLSTEARVEYDKVIENRSKQAELFNKVMSGAKFDGTKTLTDNLTNSETGPTNTKALTDFIEKVGDIPSDKLAEMQKELGKKSAKDPGKSSSWDKVSKALATLSGALGGAGGILALLKKGLSAAALAAILEKLAKSLSGCFQVNAGAGTKHLLDCEASDTLKAVCGCTTYDDLSKMCTDVNNKACPPYSYIYRTYSVFDLLGDFITGLANVPKDIAGIFGWIIKNWPIVLGGSLLFLLLLFLVPFLFKKIVHASAQQLN